LGPLGRLGFYHGFGSALTMAETFTFTSRIPAPADRVFQWHLQPGALERLTPPWQQVAVVEKRGGIAEGGEVVLQMRGPGGMPLRWVARHRDFVPGRQFVDEQVQGPFKAWRHTHRVDPDGDEACYLTDEIAYCLPGGAVGRALGGRYVRRMMQQAFTYRHAITRADVMNLRASTTPMTIAVTGSHGLIGSALIPKLTAAGHTVKRLVRRREAGENEIAWLPDDDWIDDAALAGVDAVVHLAGESIQGRWTAAKKQRIRDSRVGGTSLLAEALAERNDGPGVLISASAVGYYGDRGDDVLTEESARGKGFLAEVAEQWESAAEPAVAAGIRVAHPRLGAVLSPAGGALKQMLPIFRMGAGGRVGSGKQWLPWVAIDDVIAAIDYALRDDELIGPFNVTAPGVVTNETFAKTLGRVLGRPAVMPAPAFMLRPAFGEIIDEAMLASQRVQPAKLQARGYQFLYPEIEPALRHLLGKQPVAATG
jgi:uncharacterized protein (TIGR01777 family)